MKSIPREEQDPRDPDHEAEVAEEIAMSDKLVRTQTAARNLALGRKYSDQIQARMLSEGALNESDAEIERTLASCVCGHWLVDAAKALREAGLPLLPR